MASSYLESEIERRSRAAMTRWQAARLREQVRHAAAHSPFYWRKFKAAGVRPALIQSVADLGRQPFTTKDELKENQAANPPWRDVLEHLVAGRLKPVIDRAFPLTDARAAVQHVLDRKNRGKVLLVP